MYKLVLVVRRAYTQFSVRVVGMCALVFSALLVGPAGALATESAGETKVKEVATQVSSEGVSIILAILGALVTLIALVIILPKAVKFIKRFI
jgi:hypothetical protein